MKPSRPSESLSQSDWQQTPPTVQAYLLNLHQRLGQLQQQIERLQNRLQRTAADIRQTTLVGFALPKTRRQPKQAHRQTRRPTRSPAQVPSYTVPPSGKLSILNPAFVVKACRV